MLLTANRFSGLVLLLLFLAYGNFGWVLAGFQRDQIKTFKEVEHGTLGWFLVAFNLPWFVWLSAGLLAVLLAVLLASPLSNQRDFFVRLFQSDLAIFAFATLAAFIAVILFAWIHIFSQFLALLAAGVLVRLEGQASGFKDWQVFWLLIGIPILGLGTGVAGHHLLVTL